MTTTTSRPSVPAADIVAAMLTIHQRIVAERDDLVAEGRDGTDTGYDADDRVWAYREAFEDLYVALGIGTVADFQRLDADSTD